MESKEQEDRVFQAESKLGTEGPELFYGEKDAEGEVISSSSSEEGSGVEAWTACTEDEEVTDIVASNERQVNPILKVCSCCFVYGCTVYVINPF